MSQEPSSGPVTISDEYSGDITIGYAPDDTPAVPAPDPEPTQPPVAGDAGEATPPTPPDDTEYIKLNRKQLAAEIRRLEAEDSEFANQYNIHVGNKAARKYKPIIDDLNAKLEAATKELRRREMLAIPDDEKAKLFETNPAWAKEYAELVHTNPNSILAQQKARAEQEAIQNRLTDTFAAFESRGLDEDSRKAVLADIRSGKYDKDSDGNIINPYEAIVLIQQDLSDRLLESARKGASTPAPTTPVASKPEPEVQAPNLALIAPGPDTTTTGVVRSGGQRDPVRDYQNILKSGKEIDPDEVNRLTARYLTME